MPRFLFALIVLYSLSASAAETKAGHCPPVARTMLTVGIKGEQPKAEAVRAAVEGLNAQLLALAKEPGLSSLKLASYDYTISPLPEGKGYRYRGSSRFELDPTVSEAVLFDALAKQKHPASLRVSYRLPKRCNGAKDAPKAK